ncbi:MAG: hypothetical protein L0K56_05615 [Corynebacterium sp.]|nr:hypothetical protein [Corynebacterium sp.]
MAREARIRHATRGEDSGRGRTGTPAHDGTAIMCDNYMWQLNQGQTPSHPWVDGQIAWSECLETNTAEQCRELLND